jgi:hypothetical protein
MEPKSGAEDSTGAASGSKAALGSELALVPVLCGIALGPRSLTFLSLKGADKHDSKRKER